MTLSIGGSAASFDVTTLAGTCYSLVTAAQPGAGGSVNTSLAPNCSNGSLYAAGTQMQLSASSRYGYLFGNWSGAANGALNPLALTMDGDKSITAHFIVDSTVPALATQIPSLNVWGLAFLVALIGFMAALGLRKQTD
jgi:hypothetical protein